MALLLTEPIVSGAEKLWMAVSGSLFFTFLLFSLPLWVARYMGNVLGLHTTQYERTQEFEDQNLR